MMNKNIPKTTKHILKLLKTYPKLLNTHQTHIIHTEFINFNNNLFNTVNIYCIVINVKINFRTEHKYNSSLK